MSNNSERFAKQTQKIGGIEFAPIYFNSTTKTVLNMILTNLFKKFCIEQIIELMKNLVG